MHPIPDWHPGTAFPEPLPATCAGWLLAGGSLTRRLRALSGQQFSVQVHAEGWNLLRPDECQALQLPASSRGWVREVFLCGHQQPWVFARSSAAQPGLPGSGLDLRQQGSRPLGDWLFVDGQFSRSPLQLCHYPPELLPAAPATGTVPLWGRRSCFSRQDFRLLVSEIFLPAFWLQAAGQSPEPA